MTLSLRSLSLSLFLCALALLCVARSLTFRPAAFPNKQKKIHALKVHCERVRCVCVCVGVCVCVDLSYLIIHYLTLTLSGVLFGNQKIKKKRKNALTELNTHTHARTCRQRDNWQHTYIHAYTHTDAYTIHCCGCLFHFIILAQIVVVVVVALQVSYNCLSLQF